MVAYERAFGDKWDPVQRSTLERKMDEALFRQGQHEQALAYVIGAKARLHRLLTTMPKSAWGIRLAIAAQIVRRIGQSGLAHLPVRRVGRRSIRSSSTRLHVSASHRLDRLFPQS